MTLITLFTVMKPRLSLVLGDVDRLTSPEANLSYPRLNIHQDLPSPNSLEMSPATLYHYGLMHTITLNGTADGGLLLSCLKHVLIIVAEFAEHGSTVEEDLGPTLEHLKNM